MSDEIVVTFDREKTEREGVTPAGRVETYYFRYGRGEASREMEIGGNRVEDSNWIASGSLMAHAEKIARALAREEFAREDRMRAKAEAAAAQPAPPAETGRNYFVVSASDRGLHMYVVKAESPAAARDVVLNDGSATVLWIQEVTYDTDLLSTLEYAAQRVERAMED